MMNHIMFFPAFDQLARHSAGQAVASPAGEGNGVETINDQGDFERVSVVVPGSAPMVFHGRVVISETFADHALTLYETDDDGFVCLFGQVSLAHTPSLQVMAAGSADDVAQILATLDPLRLVDANIPPDVSARESLLILQERLSAAHAALTSLASILNVDASDAIARIAALCDGEQTWLQ